MSITPPRLPRRSSIWSVLRSLETLSSPPSWSSLASLATHSQVGSIPIIFHDGDEDSPDSMSYLRFDTGQDVSLRHFSTIGLLDHGLELEVQTIKDDSTGAISLTRNSNSIGHRDTQTTPPKAPRPYSPMTMDSCAHRECPLPRSPSQPARFQEAVVMMTPPRASPTLPEPELAPHLRSSHGDPSTTPHSARSSSLDSCRSSLTTEEPSPTKGSRFHEHDGSTSLCSNLPLASVDTSSETLDVDSERFPLLPLSLSWLKSTVLELMIDQEGFRMIQPPFRLAGYSRPPTLASAADLQLVSATADFMPVERKSFTFHHSSLDTPPVFRRLLVNGDESHDYLSRQAYLILKANGPYTVHGTEPVQSARLIPNADPPVLAWRFDYLVGDRRTEAGRIIPGEKTFTPLSFSCSPGLLQPAQARKIRVVHVVKKSVAPKLTAIKMGPPVPPRHHLVPRFGPLHHTASEHQETDVKIHGRTPSHVRRSEPSRASTHITPASRHSPRETVPHITDSSP
ncbi:hypothetical protein EI94DRAFT_1716917 [Lactarius quietus]|nr:hypothetical protein EI94DRAFT_1716917 [Lactarius quietus]